MLPTIYLLGVYFISHIRECHDHYVDSYTQNRMRMFFYALDRELIKDAWQKVKSVQYMKALYIKSPSYHVADRIFFLRKKFARMMRVYQWASYRLSSINSNTWQIGYFLDLFQEIQFLAMEIDHLVEAVTEWEERPAKMYNIGGLMLPAENFKLKNIMPSIPDREKLQNRPHGRPGANGGSARLGAPRVARAQQRGKFG